MSGDEFQYTRRLFHYETDADGVCHFSNYFRICEEALMEFLRQHSVPLEHAEHSLAVVRAEASYCAPLRFGEPFAVALECTQMRRSWFELVGSIKDSNDTLCAQLTLKLAALKKGSNEPMPLPQEIRGLNASHRRS